MEIYRPPESYQRDLAAYDAKLWNASRAIGPRLLRPIADFRAYNWYDYDAQFCQWQSGEFFGRRSLQAVLQIVEAGDDDLSLVRTIGYRLYDSTAADAGLVVEERLSEFFAESNTSPADLLRAIKGWRLQRSLGLQLPSQEVYDRLLTEMHYASVDL